MSKRTIYRYFKSKDEIIEGVIDRFLTSVSGEMERIVTTKKFSEEAFADMLETFYRLGRSYLNPVVMQDMRQHYPHYWEKIDRFRMSRAQEVFKTFLERSDKETIREINPRVATAIVLASVQAVLNPEFILSNGLNFHETVEQVIEFFKHGFLKGTDGGGSANNDS